MSSGFLRTVLAICSILIVVAIYQGLDIYKQSQLTEKEKMELAQAEKQKQVEEIQARAERKLRFKQQAAERQLLIQQSFFDVASGQRANWIIGYMENNRQKTLLAIILMVFIAYGLSLVRLKNSGGAA